MSDRFDVIVVGVGAMGAAACHHLAKMNARVLGLEKFDIPHGNGSSAGFSRMIRMSYYEHPDYVPLLKSAFSMWRELEGESGQKLMHVTGCLYLGPPEGKILAGALRSARTFDLPFELFDRAGIERSFPQFRVPANFIGMREREAGFVVPELAIATHALQALQRGAELHGRESVTGWVANKSGVRVVTDRGEYSASRIIFCGGAWTDQLVRDLGAPLRVTRQVAGWVWPRKPALFALHEIPCWMIDHLDGSCHYGFPMMPESPGFKLAHHRPGPATDPDSVDRAVLPGDEASFRNVLRENIPDADGPILSMRSCLYTNSADGDFIVDRHPAHENVWLACGFSGHGFKFAPVIGEALAELALKGASKHPVDFLRCSRPR